MKKGVQRALLAAVLFGISAPAAKALTGNLRPQLLAGILYLGSGGGLMIVGWLQRKSAQTTEMQITGNDVRYLAGAIAVGGVAAPILLMVGIERTPASGAALLLNLEAVFTAVVAWLVFHENLGKRIVFGTVAILAGGILLSWSGGPMTASELAGPLAVAGACLCWAVDNNLTQQISAGDPVQIAKWKGLAGGSVNVLLASLLHGQWPDASWTIVAALALGFVSYGVSLVLYILALRELGTARAGNYFAFAPFVGAITGLVVFHERLSGQLLGAGGLMAAGIWLHVTEYHEHRHIHEPLEHEHFHVHDEHHVHEHQADDPEGEPHSHPHRHERLEHRHPHYPDIHHRHRH
jgi:drug/metabolite transporter (DMT)-like permease